MIAPLACSEAGKMQGLNVDVQKGELVISNGDPKTAVVRLGSERTLYL